MAPSPSLTPRYAAACAAPCRAAPRPCPPSPPQLSRQEVPTARQTVLVSSVLPGALAALADEALLKDALRVVVGGTSGISSVVQQVGGTEGHSVKWVEGGEGAEK